MSDSSVFFQYQMCGDCCRGFGGTFVDEQEIEAISKYLDMDRATFLRDYCHWSGKRPLIRTAESGYCIFFDKLCTIHEVKPRMCKLWPFIEGVLADPANWTAMHTMCPGIRTDVDKEELTAHIRQELLKHSK